MFSLPPPRHISTLPNSENLKVSICRPVTLDSGHGADVLACPRSANNGLMHRSNLRLYSITSSARCCKINGTVIPSALAVLRLMTSSYLVGACTGRSAGFSPFSMRSA